MRKTSEKKKKPTKEKVFRKKHDAEKDSRSRIQREIDASSENGVGEEVGDQHPKGRNTFFKVPKRDAKWS